MPATYLCQADFAFGKSGTPTDSILLTISTGGSSPDNGSVIATSSVAAASFSSGDVVTMDFPVCYGISPSSTVYFTFSRTGSLSNTNFYSVGATRSSNSASFNNTDVQYVPSSWSDDTVAVATRLRGTQNASTTISLLLPTFGVSSSSATFVCPDWGLFTPLCDFAVWAVVPPASVTTQLEAVRSDLLATRFPFAYFSELSTAWNATTTATSTPSITLPFAGHQIQFLGPSSGSDFVGSSNWSILQTLLGTAIWLSFGFYVYDRIRSITSSV